MYDALRCVGGWLCNVWLMKLWLFLHRNERKKRFYFLVDWFVEFASSYFTKVVVSNTWTWYTPAHTHSAHTQFHMKTVHDSVVVVVVTLRKIHDMRTVFETTTETTADSLSKMMCTNWTSMSLFFTTFSNTHHHSL